QEEGGDYLHVVDLDAAFSGEQRNLDGVRAICAAVTIPVEVGGGIRDVDAARRAIGAGASRVIVGTRAVQSLAFVAELTTELGGERVAVGIDARNGMVSVKGLTEICR